VGQSRSSGAKHRVVSNRALWSRERESREAFLSSSYALVIELCSVALILAFFFRACAPPFHQCFAIVVSSAVIRLADIFFRLGAWILLLAG